MGAELEKEGRQASPEGEVESPEASLSGVLKLLGLRTSLSS